MPSKAFLQTFLIRKGFKKLTQSLESNTGFKNTFYVFDMSHFLKTANLSFYCTVSVSPEFSEIECFYFLIPQAKCTEPHVLLSSKSSSTECKRWNQIHLKFNKNYRRSILRSKCLSTLVNLFCFEHATKELKLFFAGGILGLFQLCSEGKKRVYLNLAHKILWETIQCLSVEYN